MGVRFLDARNLGRHGYRSGRGERNGIAYTCRGGHIDVTHLRKIADWSAYLAYQVRETMIRGDQTFTFKMFEPSRHHVTVEYPSGWEYLSPETRREIGTDVAISVGAYLAYTCSVWHEILTWHGFRGIGFYPEYNSAFSWEDNYSNALGSYLAVQALRDREHDYEEAMKRLIDETFRRLGPQPKETAVAAGKAVKGWWFVGAFIRVTMVKRHLDIGWDDGFVTPWLVPNVAGCGTSEPWSCPVPNLKSVEACGFHVHHEIQPREWERHKILRAVYSNPADRKRNRIVPSRHFGILIEHVKAQANERYGPYAHLMTPPSPATDAPPALHARADEPRADVLAGSPPNLTEPGEPSWRPAVVSYEASPEPADRDEPDRGFFGFLKSAVSWLADSMP